MLHRAFSVRRLVLVAVAGIALTLAVAPSSASAANWSCDASALRGTVLGQTIEPLTANRDQALCNAFSSTLPGTGTALPLPLDIGSLAVATSLLNADKDVPLQQAGSFGGLTDLRIRSLPELPIQVPLPDLSQYAAVSVPLVGTVDLRPALQALLPDGRLPTADLLGLRSLSATATGQCDGGQPKLLGESRVAGLTVLGQELPVDEAITRTVTLIDSSSIDPSNANLSLITLPAGITLDPLVSAQLQSVLDGLPNIEIPATLATVKVTPGQQLRDGSTLTQRALQVDVGVLGQTLANLLIGEARVGHNAVACQSVPGSAAQSLALQCTTRKLVLSDVIPAGDRVRLVGFADKRYIGRTVDIHFTADGRRVARTVIRKDGTFSTTAPMPVRRLRATNRARYEARLGTEKSMRLKLQRRMIVDTMKAKGRQITIAGRVVKPLARPVATIEVRRRVSCNKWEVVKRIRPSRSGRFRTTLEGPPNQLAAVYRFATRVRKFRRNPKTFPTFTLPRYVDLG